MHAALLALLELVVMWPEGHCRQDTEPGAGWYLLIGQSLHGGTTSQSLKPTLVEILSDLKVNVVAIPDAAMDAGRAVESAVLPQYLLPSTSRYSQSHE